MKYSRATAKRDSWKLIQSKYIETILPVNANGSNISMRHYCEFRIPSTNSHLVAFPTMLLEVKAKVVKLTGIAITEAEEREKMLPSDVLLYSMFRTVSVYLNRKQVEYLYSCVIICLIFIS